MEEITMLTNILNQKRCSVYRFGFAIIVAALMVVGFYQMGIAADVKQVKQKNFQTPEEAAKTLFEALRAGDMKELLAIFGPAGKEVISSGDEVADKAGRERFVKAYEAMNKLEKETDKKVMLVIGNHDWPFPIPIVRKGETWVFDTMAGKEEMLNRRIGRNELNTIKVCLAYVDAQREYALKDRDSDKLLEYAQKFGSTPGKKDGLYWQAKEGEER